MTEFENKLGYTFQNRTYIHTALTHSSYANENKHSGIVCNERMEFLGDSILGLTVAEYLYRNFPDLPEGQMTRLRAELVCERSLVSVAQKLELGCYLRLGKGEEQNGGRNRKSILADAVEAVIAAIYLDSNREAAEEMIRRLILKPFEDGKIGENRDYKTELQELVQRNSGQQISYQLEDEQGPDHAKQFTFQVLINGKIIGRGTGKSKKEAEQAAAESALEAMKR